MNNLLYDAPVIGSKRDQKVRDGLIFIPDISGFTELVRSTDVLTGKNITYELLSAIVDQNILGMKISEVEGDAVLFYRYGKAPSLCQLLKQYKSMSDAFDRKLSELQKYFDHPLDLSLKIIAHYGPMAEFRIDKFEKLYGEVVVEAHRLLKNSISSNRYLLLTDELLTFSDMIDQEELLAHGIHSTKLCEVYGGLRNISFTYFDFQKNKVLELAV